LLWARAGKIFKIFNDFYLNVFNGFS
jgi:hypothetical protein